MSMDELTSLDLRDVDLATRAAAREIASKEIAPRAREVDEREAFPHEGLRHLLDAGFAGILVPEADGGSGGTMLQYCLVMEEVAHACAATSATFMTQVHGLLPILMVGDADQRQRWLPGAVSGERIASIALTEPQAGSDVASMRTTAVRADGGYRISGSKIFITNGNEAGLMSVFARTDPDDRHGGISIFVVELPCEGVTFGPPLKKMGIRGSDTAEVFLDGVQVGEDQRLGEEGAGFLTAIGALGDARISTAAQAVGVARRAYEIAEAYTAEREQFGRPIRDFQAVQLALMEMYTDVVSARLLLYQVARLIDAEARDEYGVEAAMAKVRCSDIAMRVASRAVDLLGGYGYMREYEVERLMRDAKVTQIYDGTNDINRINMAKQLRRREAGGSGGRT
jgi:alkylation response protein AidB-like acyl-CoA dehydrogenase